MPHHLYQMIGYEFLVADVDNPHVDSPGPRQFLMPKGSAHRPACQHLLQGKIWEPSTHRNFTRILARRPGSVVHAGTFFGDMLHVLSAHAVSVHAFEPVLENFVFAKMNAQRLGLSNVYLHCSGLSDGRETRWIQTSRTDGTPLGGASQFHAKDPSGQHAELTRVTTIDSLGLSDVSLIHLDVEGWELRALLGAVETIRKTWSILMLEDNLGNCRDPLRALGYTRVFQVDSLDYYAARADLAFLQGLAD